MISETRTDYYDYNDRNELISAAKNAESAEEYAYQYDDIGNRIQKGQTLLPQLKEFLKGLCDCYITIKAQYENISVSKKEIDVRIVPPRISTSALPFPL